MNEHETAELMAQLAQDEDPNVAQVTTVGMPDVWLRALRDTYAETMVRPEVPRAMRDWYSQMVQQLSSILHWREKQEAPAMRAWLGLPSVEEVMSAAPAELLAANESDPAEGDEE